MRCSDHAGSHGVPDGARRGVSPAAACSTEIAVFDRGPQLAGTQEARLTRLTVAASFIGALLPGRTEEA